MKIIIFAMLLMMMVACKPHPSSERYTKFKALENKDFMKDAWKIRVFREFEEGFKIRHFMFLRGSVPNTAILSAKALLHDRYIIVMRLPVKDAGDGRMIQASGDVEWFLYEIDKVDGRNISYTPNQRRLSERDWNTLVNSRMDFSVIGYEMKTDKPIPGLREIYAAG